MEWRCEWCGKPHEADDPPCDECGHHKFERAVEPIGPQHADDPQDPVWVCTDCGRTHQKHSPPCSRCGNHSLEQRQQDFDLEELGGTSYMDVLETKYVLGYVAVALFGGILVLGYLGYVPLPIFDDGATASPPDVPGYNESVDGLSLAETEDLYVAQINHERQADGNRELTRNADLDMAATYYNTRRVEAAYENAPPPDAEELNENFDSPCRGHLVRDRIQTEIGPNGSADAYDNETQLASDVQPSNLDIRANLVSSEYDEIGLDVHVGPDGQAFVTAILC